MRAISSGARPPSRRRSGSGPFEVAARPLRHEPGTGQQPVHDGGREFELLGHLVHGERLADDGGSRDRDFSFSKMKRKSEISRGKVWDWAVIVTLRGPGRGCKRASSRPRGNPSGL